MPENKRTTISVTARFSNLEDLLAPVSFGLNPVESNFDNKIPLHANLALEELFANTIHHGYGKESDARVWLTVERDASLLRITYADAAPEFDPFAGNFESVAMEGVEDQRVGGLGRLLIKQTARHCAYRREAGRNVITLEFTLKPSAGA